MINVNILSLLLLILSPTLHSQETFRKSLESISTDLCAKMAEKGKKKIVVLYITDINKAQTTVGKYMADVISYNIVNNSNSFSVFDRENLSGITEAKKLIAEGYIDVNSAKQLGQILSVETIVVGNYTVLSKTLSLTLKALDVRDGFVIAQTMKDLPIDNDASTLLGVNFDSANNKSNKGFNNHPINSNESYNNPETVTKQCEINNFGDYCFENHSKNTLVVRIRDKQACANCIGQRFKVNQSITLFPGQTQCFYNIQAGVLFYDMKENRTKSKLSNGQINVEKCKSKTFEIK